MMNSLIVCIPIAEGCVHVEMRVHKMRAQQVTASVQRFMGRRVQPGGDVRNSAVLHGDAHALPPVGQGGVLDKQVEHQRHTFKLLQNKELLRQYPRGLEAYFVP